MKNCKMILLVLMIALIGLCFSGCADHETETNSGKTVIIDWNPIFDTDSISRITFFSQATDAAPAEVPDEYMREITQWLGSFLPDEEINAHSVAAPGADSYSVRIEYADGTVAEGSLDTCTINGTRYRLTSAPTPACWFAIWETAPENRKQKHYRRQAVCIVLGGIGYEKVLDLRNNPDLARRTCRMRRRRNWL